MKNIADEVEKHRRVIKHDSVVFSINELVEMYRRKEIIIKPQFQRLFRWTREQQSNLIESVILEIPIPPLFFYENQEGIWELLDGLQRMSTLIRFFTKNEIPREAQGEAGNENEWHYTHANNLEAPLQLLGGEYLTSLDGMSMYTLPVPLQLNLKRLRQMIVILKRETDPMYKYEVFKRLNTGGSQIEDQEFRNCSVRILSDEFPDFLQAIAKNGDFVAALGLADADMRNGYVEELALRFFAIKNHADHFKHDVEEFLTKYMEEIARKSLRFDIPVETALFERIWRVLNKAATDGVAFCSKREDGRDVGPFSPSVFEMVLAGFAANIDRLEQLHPAEVKELIIATIQEAKRQGLTGAGSNSKPKFDRRLSFGKANLRK